MKRAWRAFVTNRTYEEDIEHGLHDGHTAAYITSATHKHHIVTTSYEREATTKPEAPSLFGKLRDRFSKSEDEQPTGNDAQQKPLSTWGIIAWTAVGGMFLLIVGTRCWRVLFVFLCNVKGCMK
jgi:hypothetical protein